MFNSKFILGLIFCVFCVLLSCKKHETLPELDALGNNMNPKSGTEYVKLDSTRVYNSTSKILKSYISIDATSISNMGFTWSQIHVYKNGNFATFFLNSGSNNKLFLDNVVSGQVLKFEFTVIDSNGRESKKSKLYTVIIP